MGSYPRPPDILRPLVKVSNTLLRKCLASILTAEKISLPADALSSVVASAEGDVRSAVNALQMACHGDPPSTILSPFDNIIIISGFIPLQRAEPSRQCLPCQK